MGKRNGDRGSSFVRAGGFARGHGRTAAADVVFRTNRRAYTHNRKNIKSPSAVGPLEALVIPSARNDRAILNLANSFPPFFERSRAITRRLIMQIIM